MKKKILIFIFLFFICLGSINAENKFEVDFYDCVDGDTAKFLYKEEKITARFLAIDTPETVDPKEEVEEFGKEASNFTCDKIKNAKKIILEYDSDSDKLDKYKRHLVWVFVDDELLQEQLVKNGLAEIKYIYGDYKYLEKLEKAEKYSQDKKLGIWKEETEEVKETTKKENNSINDLTIFINKYKEYIILIGALIIVSIFNLKPKNKIKNKLKRKVVKDIKKRFK